MKAVLVTGARLSAWFFQVLVKVGENPLTSMPLPVGFCGWLLPYAALVEKARVSNGEGWGRRGDAGAGCFSRC